MSHHNNLRGEIRSRVAVNSIPLFGVDSLDPLRTQSSKLDGGYTSGMKTAVSVPDDVFEKVERLARRARKSRSEVFSAALREYVARHAPDEVTESMNEVCDKANHGRDQFVAKASRRVLENVEW